MTNITKRLLALLLTFVLVISAYVPTYSATDYPTTYSKSANSGERDEVCTTLNGTSAGSYYTEGLYDVETLSKLSGEELYTALDTLMTNTHTTITKYDNCRDYAVKTDCQNADGTSVILFYTSYVGNRKLYTADTPGGWNREHLWPQSLGGNSLSPQVGEKLGGADLHHIRPADSSINSSRGNKPYGYADAARGGYGTSKSHQVTGKIPGGTYDNIYFEPHDNVKGDVARIILYVYVRWGSEWGADSVTEVFESVDVLLEWCALDPVDTWEMGRNEVVQAIQGNRNVFIDYPEYAWLLFDREVPSDMTTPSGEAGNGSFITCSHPNTAIKGVVAATCGATGYTGDTYCVDCQKVTVKGTTISATGLHTFSAWEINQASGTKTRTCSGCSKVETAAIDAAECEHINTQLVNKKDATCGASGYTGDLRCSGCGEIREKGSEIAPTGNHTYGDTVVTTDPTFTEKGEGKQICNGCQHEIIVAVPSVSETLTSVTPEELLSYAGSDTDILLILMILGYNEKLFVGEYTK